MKITFEEALAVCIQYYVDRGYSVEHATAYVNRGEKEVFWLHEQIQKEKKLPQNVATVVSLSDLVRGRTAETDAADG